MPPRQMPTPSEVATVTDATSGERNQIISGWIDIEPEHGQAHAARNFVAPLLGDDVHDRLFMTALTEVVTNAIDAHLRIESTERIRIERDLERGVVTVTDRGEGFDIDQIEAGRGAGGDVESSRRGSGLDIVRSAVTAVTSFNPSGGGTSVELRLPTVA